MLPTERHIPTSLFVQRHLIPFPGVVEGGRHAGLAMQVLQVCTGDLHALAEEWALRPDLRIDSLQFFWNPCEVSCRR